MDLHNRLLILFSVVIIITISTITVKMKIRIFIVLQQFRKDCWVWFQSFRWWNQPNVFCGWLFGVSGGLRLIIANLGSFWWVLNFGWFRMVLDSFAWFRVLCCFSSYLWFCHQYRWFSRIFATFSYLFDLERVFVKKRLCETGELSSFWYNISPPLVLVCWQLV